MGVINFYGVGGDYGCFSNFSPYPVVDLAGERVLFPGAEVRWDARRGGVPPCQVPPIPAVLLTVMRKGLQEVFMDDMPSRAASLTGNWTNYQGTGELDDLPSISRRDNPPADQ